MGCDCARALRRRCARFPSSTLRTALTSRHWTCYSCGPESAASSKFEAVEASLEDYARALHGIRTNSSAVSMVAATAAVDAMINDVSRHDRIELAAITSAHDVLMRDDPAEARCAGRLRTVQNWIGGSNHSPRGALYVPPPPATVPDHMADLLTFANRGDLPALVQAAIAHAQFESIHPFTDGNGRIGRALINTLLRRRGATTRVVIPMASALVARRDRYGPRSSAFAAINRLQDAGVLRPLTDRRRDQVWGASTSPRPLPVRRWKTWPQGWNSAPSLPCFLGDVGQDMTCVRLQVRPYREQSGQVRVLHRGRSPTLG
jgi:hypothetical protein